MNPSVAPQGAPPRLVSKRTLHLMTLSGFAIAQPSLTALASRSVYLHDYKFGWEEISILLAVLLILAPLVWIVVDQIVVRVTRFFRIRGRNLVIGTLVTLLMLTLLRPYFCLPALLRTGLAGYLDVSISLTVGIAVASYYERVTWLQSWLTWASIGVLVFPASFILQFESIRKEVLALESRVEIQKPVPVVFLVFDELSGITLCNEQEEIDAVRFPQFARLAKLSNWYRNATTVNPRTHVAVPTILSGRYPVAEHSPLAAEYPGNLFEVIAASEQYDMAVFEPISRLCPETVRFAARTERTFEERCPHLLYSMAAVYPRLIFTVDVPFLYPTIPRPWFGLPETFTADLSDLVHHSKGLYRFSGTEYRHFQQQHFLRCLEPSAKPRFCFMHTVLPHYPWCYLPNGDQYESEFASSPVPLGGGGELGEDWENDLSTVLKNEHRYRMQLGFVDRFIGQVLDRLEDTGQLDDCLLIVAADHGVSFRPGNSRRLPGKDNLAEIWSVPLFIKFPHQTESRVDDRNIETIDLYPTMAEVLGFEIPVPVDGISVNEDIRHPRKTMYFEGKMTIVEANFPQRHAAIQRQASLYKTGSDSQIATQAYRFPQWNGQPLSNFPIANYSIPAHLFDGKNPQIEETYTAEPKLSPNLVWGYVTRDVVPEFPADIVLAVDGTVIDSYRTVARDRFSQQFEFVIPPAVLDGKVGKIELFLVNNKDATLPLKRLNITSVESINGN